MSDAPAPITFDEGARCFVALLPDAASMEALLACRKALADGIPGGARRLRWIDRNALHLTLRFLGAASAAQQEQLAGALSDLSRPLHPLATRRYGIWPNRARPRLLVLELARDTALLELADACESQVQAAGFVHTNSSCCRTQPAMSTAASPHRGGRPVSPRSRPRLEGPRARWCR